MAHKLSIRNITKTFSTPEGKSVHALDDVSLEVDENEFVVLLGPSGCGKTTLLRTIAGLENSDSGEIHLGPDRLDTVPPYLRPVNTVFQSYALFPFLTIEKNIAFGLEMEKMSKADIKARVTEMLDLIELSDFGKRLPSQLSGGQRQRVALARALAKKPGLLLLDEPLAALDLKLRRTMQTELKRIQRSTGIAFVFVTHDQEEALALGDRIAVLNKGTIAQVGSPKQIYEEPTSEFVADFIGETNLLSAKINHDNTVTIAGQRTIHLNDLASDPDPNLRPDQDVVVAIRPERISISPEGQLTGSVTAADYLGAHVTLGVTLSAGTEIDVRLDTYGEIPEVGSQVQVRVDPAHTRVLTS